jgi:tRNA dimethylallyltransferase
MEKMPLVIINAPTATGKTELAIDLALEFGGEIINADSLQVYRYLDIGTAKPTKEQRNKVRHHLIDVADPDEEFNAAIFTQMARKIIQNMAEMKKPVFVVGGTGLYIRALLKGIIDTPAVDEKIRNYYRRLSDVHGKEYLFDLLKKRDSQAARRIKPNDSIRVIRALEVLEQSGESIISKQNKHTGCESPYNTFKIGLQIDREELKKRISERTKKMITAGFVKEVKSILARGYSETLKPLQSLGYKQIIKYLSLEFDLTEAVRLINRDTWHYAKRQMTWFSADKEINWFKSDCYQDLKKNVDKFWKENRILTTRNIT